MHRSTDPSIFDLPSDKLDEISAREGEEYTETFDAGFFDCARCQTPLFKSDAKFRSHCRWPAFREALPGAVKSRDDSTYGVQRTEILCNNCGLHLGHVFADGKFSGDTHPNAGTRHCVLSLSLKFRPLSA
eukprot:GILJ01009850.1.p1 GENE.GILJ01009850.1~~GILJ01009850.1.p1  ORF type:complete len:130 (+),score=10.47 GILJ01009850.1:39-428(+)